MSTRNAAFVMATVNNSLGTLADCIIDLSCAGVGVLGGQGVAVMTRAYPEDSEDRQDLVLLQNIASYMLLACGGVYVISVILCIGLLKRARQKKQVSRDQAVKDLQELERRREELEALLIVEERA